MVASRKGHCNAQRAHAATLTYAIAGLHGRFDLLRDPGAQADAAGVIAKPSRAAFALRKRNGGMVFGEGTPAR
jgi:hypothetical protein